MGNVYTIFRGNSNSWVIRFFVVPSASKFHIRTEYSLSTEQFYLTCRKLLVGTSFHFPSTIEFAKPRCVCSWEWMYSVTLPVIQEDPAFHSRLGTWFAFDPTAESHWGAVWIQTAQSCYIQSPRSGSSHRLRPMIFPHNQVTANVWLWHLEQARYFFSQSFNSFCTVSCAQLVIIFYRSV